MQLCCLAPVGAAAADTSVVQRGGLPRAGAGGGQQLPAGAVLLTSAAPQSAARLARRCGPGREAARLGGRPLYVTRLFIYTLLLHTSKSYRVRACTNTL